MHCDQWVTAVPPCHLVWERGRERERDNQPRGRLAKAMAVSLLVGEVLLSPLTWQSFKLQPVKGSLAKHCGIMHWLTDWLTTVCPDNGPHSLPFQLRKRVGMRGERGPCLPLLNLHSSSEQRVPSSLAPAPVLCLLSSLGIAPLFCLAVSLCLSSTQSRELLIHWYTNEGLSDRRITYRLLHERWAWIQLISLQRGAGLLSSWCFCLITCINRKKKKEIGWKHEESLWHPPADLAAVL